MISVLRWDTESNHLSPECRELLKKFFMAQSALSRELLEAKSLGICRTSIFGTNALSLRNPLVTSINGKSSTTFDTFGKRDSKETF